MTSEYAEPMTEAKIIFISFGFRFENRQVISSRKNETKKLSANNISTYITIKIPPLQYIINCKEGRFCQKIFQIKISAILELYRSPISL